MSENETIAERQEREKETLLAALRELPVVQIAIKKAGISRPTYYRWRQEDREFRRQTMDAMGQGVEFINDMSETQVVTLIKEKKLPAIALWLKHHHPTYGARVKSYTSISETDDLTPEEMGVVTKALAMASGGRVRTKDHEQRRPRIH